MILVGVELSRVWTFVVGAVRCTVTTAPDDGTRHPQLQRALSSAGTDEWVLSWRLNEDGVSSGDRRAVGSRFQVVSKLRWPVDVRVQGTRRAAETAERDWRRPSVEAADTQKSAMQCGAASCRHFHTGTGMCT